MIIKTERLIIRDFKHEDWPAVHKYAKQEEILRYEPWGPNTEEQTIAFIEKAISDSQIIPRTIFEFAITLANTRVLIGSCSFRVKRYKQDEVNIGYIINPEYWNQGYATEAASRLISCVIKRGDIKTISAICDEYNVTSQRVLAKSGFIKTAEKRRDLKFKNRTSKTFYYEVKFSNI